MRAEFWAILTALCWAVGSFFEKKGVKLGGFSPVMGTAIRTAVSFLFVGALSIPCWDQLRTGGAKAILMVAVAGGIVGGGLGVVFFYRALSGGQLAVVLPIAFCLTPVVGAVLGFALLGEKTNARQTAGIALTIIGATMAISFRTAPAG